MPTNAHRPFAPKFDYATAEEVRARHRAGEEPSALAREFGVARSSMYEVLRGRTHRGSVVVRLRPVDLARLERCARRRALSVDEVAADLISRGLDPRG
jgi:hypothetical protein